MLARVLVSVKPGYTDGAEVLSDTLAPGTPVTLSFRMALDATAVHFVDPSNGVGPTGAGAEYKVVLRDVDDLTLPEAQRILAVASSGVQQTSATLELSTAIGHRIELVADLIVGARVDVDYGTYEVAQGSADVLAEQTAGLFYEPSGDVRLVTDSGHDYAVPEPGRVWLTLAAALVLSGRRRRGRHPRRRVARGAAAVALACLAPSAVAASSLRALGVASAGAHRVSGLEERLLTPGPGSLQITLAAAAGDAVFAEPPPTNFEISAMVDGIGVARYGSLAGRAHAEAHSAPAGPYLAGGQVSVSPGFTDGAEVRSDTLAPDTPVTLTFRMTLAATAMHSVNPGSLDSQGTGAAARYDVALSDLDNPLQLPAAGSLVINSRGFEETSRVLELDTAIGHQVELVADLSVNANVRVDYPFLGVSDGTADVFAEQTGELFYDPSGDVRLETESGHDYAAPEPRRAILLVLAAAALLLRRGRHPRGAEALAG